MASDIIAIKEKDSGANDSQSVPYLVLEQDVALALSLEDAVDEAGAQGLSDQGVGAHAYRFQRLSKHAYRITLLYNPPTVPKLTPTPPGGTSTDFRFSFQAQSRFVTVAEECLGAYGTSGDDSDLHTLLVDLQESEGLLRPRGLHVAPAPETFSLDLILPNASVGSTYQNALSELCGAYNSTTFQGYAAGQIQLVRASGQKRTNDDWRLSLGFGYVKNRTSVAIGDITVASIPGHAIVWTRNDEVQHDDVVIAEPWLAVVQRVWPLADLSGALPS